MNNRTLGPRQLVGLPVVAVIGFMLATVLAGVSVAEVVTTSTSTSTTTSTTSTTTTTTTTTPPATGNEGCTPGFWKTHPGDYATTGYTPSTTLGSVFGGLSSTYASMTFHSALSLRGGGLDALLRHAVAASLNASSADVDYSYTSAEVIAMTNAAIANGSYETTKDLFDSANNSGAAGFCD